MSSKKKMAAVLRLRKGEDLTRDVDTRDEKISQLQKALGETALNLEISREINRVYERKHGPLALGKSNK